MKNNSIVTNLQQDLTSSEQLQARNNIDAAKTVYLTNPATGFGGDLTFDYSSNTARYEVSVGDTKVGVLPSITTEPNQILCTDASGRVVWEDNNAQPLNYSQQWDGVTTNTTVIDPTGVGYIQCPYTKLLFSCQLYSQINQNPYIISLCPVNSIGEYYSQPTLDTGGRPYTVNMPPCDDTTYGNGEHNWTTVTCMWNHPDIRYIAIKGNSDWCTLPEYNFGIKNITMIELP